MSELKAPADYDADSIYSEEVFVGIFDEEDEIEKAKLLLSFQERAELLDKKKKGTLKKFNTMLKAYKKTFEKLEKERKSSQSTLFDNQTHFNYFGDGHELKCGTWVADEDGVRTYNMFGEFLACYHPILPVERLKNLETGEEHINIAFKRNYKWQNITVPKEVVSSASKITSLSKLGVAVTSETAKYLVRYLADVENMNDNDINIQNSTSKLGWNGNDFIPYDESIVFDGESRFRQLFDSVRECGDYDVWLEHVKELRATGRKEIKFMMAASFSSVLVGLLGGLPFFVDLWGETEGGKSVSLMLAASVWANPDESQYIGDFKTTDVALEAKADVLNSLPMMLDDTSKTSARIRDNFEGIVYDLCSGKGKSRSNRDLGVNRESRWRCCFLTNGERPLSGYVNQGGAINRILEVECGEHIYKDPQNTANIVKRNYGFAGKEFIKIVKEIGIDRIKCTYSEILSQLMSSDKMQKQAMSLAIVLTADRIATEQIFNDGVYISLNEAKETLIDRNLLSDNERCYEYILDKIAMNNARFDAHTNIEKWGTIDNDYAVIYNQAFEEICRAGGFSKKSFLSWADRKGLLKTQDKRLTKVKKIDGKALRCVFLKINQDNPDDFMEFDDDEPIPFE